MHFGQVIVVAAAVNTCHSLKKGKRGRKGCIAGETAAVDVLKRTPPSPFLLRESTPIT